ncbi:MAG: hypothetical protein RL434_3081, partial [Pseudomonadota bacterium]
EQLDDSCVIGKNIGRPGFYFCQYSRMEVLDLESHV